MFFRKKLTLFILLFPLFLKGNVNGLQLIDNIKKEDVENKTSFIKKNIAEESLGNKDEYENITNKIWNGYELKSEYKYLMSQDILHEFNENDQYMKTLNKIYKEDETFLLIEEYDYGLENEKQRYVKSGFSGIPNKHITTIKNSEGYFNQLKNLYSPEVSCVPTSFTMFMYINNNINEIKPDDISRNISFTSEGTYTETVLDRLVNMGYSVHNRNYDWNFSIHKVKDYINEGKPLLVYINSGKIDYYQGDEKDSRLYNIKKSNTYSYSHSILLTGFLEIDNELYLEVYDPISYYNVFVDGQVIPSGQGIFIKHNDLRDVFKGPFVYFDVN